ncbi:MAG: glycosyltransferase [Fimbriimonas sp.]
MRSGREGKRRRSLRRATRFRSPHPQRAKNPDREEILVANDGNEVAQILKDLAEEQAAKIGRNAYERVLSEHTYAHRAEEFERALQAVAERRVVLA